ncbi:MAG: MFS transporter [bacterium]|nr:MFS transporter [bacterium]
MHPSKVYYWFLGLTTAGMLSTAATYAPFLFSLGLTVSDVAALNVWFWFVIIIAEVPTGMLADGKSRSWSVLTGITIQFCGIVTYACAQGFWSALAGEVLEGIGMAFISGALQAWLVDALHARGEGARIRKTFGTGSLIRGAVGMCAGVLSALIGTVSLRFGWVMNALFMAGAIFCAHRCMTDEGEPSHRLKEWAALDRSVAVLRKTRSLQWAIAAAMVFGLVVPFNHYWSPIFRDQVGPEMMWLVWLPMYGSLVVIGFLIRRLSIPVGEEGGFVAVALICAGLGLVGLGGSVGVAASIGFVMLHEAGRGAFEPLLDSFTNHRIESNFRATYGSLQSLLGRIGFAVTLIAVWAFTRGEQAAIPLLKQILFVCGVLLCGASIVLFFIRPKQ